MLAKRISPAAALSKPDSRMNVAWVMVLLFRFIPVEVPVVYTGTRQRTRDRNRIRRHADSFATNPERAGNPSGWSSCLVECGQSPLIGGLGASWPGFPGSAVGGGLRCGTR